MTNYPLSAQCKDFALQILHLQKWLATTKKEFVVSHQLAKSGTSIGANVTEAQYAISKKEFICKMQIALKEAAESEYWLFLLKELDYIPEDKSYLIPQCETLKKLLIASIRTAKKNTNN